MIKWTCKLSHSFINNSINAFFLFILPAFLYIVIFLFYLLSTCLITFLFNTNKAIVHCLLFTGFFIYIGSVAFRWRTDLLLFHFAFWQFTNTNFPFLTCRHELIFSDLHVLLISLYLYFAVNILPLVLLRFSFHLFPSVFFLC